VSSSLLPLVSPNVPEAVFFEGPIDTLKNFPVPLLTKRHFYDLREPTSKLLKASPSLPRRVHLEAFYHHLTLCLLH
jgi:hypothetical protein